MAFNRVLPPFIVIACLLAIACPAWAHAERPYHNVISSKQCCLVIAHAGGGIDGNPYTNSEEALLANLEMGVRVFEVDFSKTRDNVWVGTHDWGTWKKQTLFTGEVPPSFDEFSNTKLLIHGSTYTPITVAFLERIVKQHPGIVLITDTKNKLDQMATALKSSRLFPNIYPQAYSPEDVIMLRKLGYKNIILTLYKMDTQNPEALIKKIAGLTKDLYALTVPMLFFAKHHNSLRRLEARVFVHGPPTHINSRELHTKFRRLGAAGFYLD